MPNPAHAVVVARPDRAAQARMLVETLGGRYSVEAGINVDRGRGEVERWFLAATLFGTRISAAVALRTFQVFDAAGVRTISDAGARSWDDLVELLDRGGYTRYDYRTASRLLALSAAVQERYPHGIATMGAAATSGSRLTSALDALPGWGPVTISAFLRELRGVWPAVRISLDERARAAAIHVGWGRPAEPFTLRRIEALARRAGVDPRDLEAALVRLALAHRGGIDACTPAGRGPCEHLPEVVRA